MHSEIGTHIPRTSKMKALIADDEPIIADTLAIILNQAGFEARAVYSGEEALIMAKSIQPDLLISDVVMTGITGIAAAIKIRADLPSCKILLFSGQAVTSDLLEEARIQNHEFEVLAKPIHPTDLLIKLGRPEMSAGAIPEKPLLITDKLSRR